ncbi:hypothetical protein A1Q1_07981 [Trichosporon asahii var. asahii CBS 2479]|uniref:Glutaredoxin domain-containing protein n=1 Tax=Trichosporon asahii var. asahii (strain ATCC 90039 / CBS 2479 / JCM 2466 / KCTC 7840 / NBRC 103889/ NCYC 2677 / UAMH 7654) TaxID=1186058 RepID=J5TGL5_TRIAS|nr:hypothetical protein A1Q1_07981 [Trichosporon asahii var. asahii CBS 2479]EJT50831.1 hypothetical protein A1Q1_07981 [Trichosporon asahii var. asahii CBS 2479]
MFARAGLRTLNSLPRARFAQVSQQIAQRRALSDEARKLIDNAVHENPLVVFMKGTPEQPQCGFSRAVCQILEVQGVPREKIVSYNCLEDPELREGIKEYSSTSRAMHQDGELEKLLVKEGLAPELPPLEEESK